MSFPNITAFWVVTWLGTSPPPLEEDFVLQRRIYASSEEAYAGAERVRAAGGKNVSVRREEH